MHGTPLFVVTALLLCSAGCGAFKPPISESERAEIDAQLESASTQADQMNAAWKTSLDAAAGGAVVPRSDLGPCPLEVGQNRQSLSDLQGAPEGIDQMVVQMQASQAMFGDSEKMVVSEAPPAEGPRARMMAREIEDIRQLLDDADMLRYSGKTGEDLVAEASEMADPGWWTWDLVVIIDKTTSPSQVDEAGGTFVAGQARGRTFVYDYTAGKVVCAGEFLATNAETVEYTRHFIDPPAAHGAVHTDLHAQALEQGIRSVAAAGPPVAE